MEHRVVSIGNDTFVLVGTPDAIAVMGAKTSRAPQIEKRYAELLAAAGTSTWDMSNPPPPVEDFLRKNLGEYGHASIAEMSNPCVHKRGLAWSTCWAIEDFPLFTGQEVSTRAVDMSGEGSRVCDRGHVVSEALHDMWMSLYLRVKSAAGKRGVYKHDVARMFLPGTASSGVTLTSNARVTLRHLSNIAALSESMRGVVESVVDGYRYASPMTTECVWGKDPDVRAVPTFGVAETSSERMRLQSGEFGVTLTLPSDMSPRNSIRNPTPRASKQQYLDPVWEMAPRISWSFMSSVAGARDWHRHRGVMPWQFYVMLDADTKKLYVLPWIQKLVNDLGIRADFEAAMALSTAEFMALQSTRSPWDALLALPFCATLQMRCRASLPKLVYALELRAYAKGGHDEYRRQALDTLRKLCVVLPGQIVAAEHLQPPDAT